jgi:hypothetical protein
LGRVLIRAAWHHDLAGKIGYQFWSVLMFQAWLENNE